MAICNSFLNERDDALVEAAQRGEFSGLQSCTPEQRAAWGKAVPAAEAAKEASGIRCLIENINNAKDSLRERLAKEEREPTPTEKLDLEVVPATEKLQYEIGRKLRIDDIELANFPTVYGTKGVENTTELIEKTMKTLYNAKMEQELWDVTACDGIMFIDHKTAEERKISAGIGGFVQSVGELIGNPQLRRIIHIVLDENGKIPRKGIPKDVPDDKVLLWGISHEIFHVNTHYYHDEVTGEEVGGPGSIERLIGLDNIDGQNEWDRTREIQKAVGLTDYGKEGEEFDAQCFAAWETNYHRLCPELKNFFDKYLSKK